MKKEEFVALGLTEEQATKAEKASLDELKGFIPKSRFDEVNNSKKQLEEDVKTRDKQLKGLKASVGDNEELKNQIETLQAENKTNKETYDAQLSEIKMNNAVNTALLGAKAKNTKAVTALIDKSKLKLDGDSVLGLKEQLKILTTAEDTKFLFGSTEKPTLKGTNPGEGKDKGKSDGITKQQFHKMGYKERLEIYNSDKETYDTLISD